MNHLPDINAEIESTQRLGGLVRLYWRDASFVQTSSDSTPIWSQYIGLITAARFGEVFYATTFDSSSTSIQKSI
ncbi:MAG: hypothetical protein OSA98_16280 [Rubripirellula sp.]|nr:hypothetical protein [Rubripirellula sp.]